jgi:hypothetical protein
LKGDELKERGEEYGWLGFERKEEGLFLGCCGWGPE